MNHKLDDFDIKIEMTENGSLAFEINTGELWTKFFVSKDLVVSSEDVTADESDLRLC